MIPPERSKFQELHPFARLARLLEGIEPGCPEAGVMTLSIGEPQSRPPTFVAEELTAAAAGWSRYPPPRGTPAYREAAHGWLQRRFGLPEAMIDAEHQILPLPGSREGLFFAVLAASGAADDSGRQATVLMPNPFYHVYSGAALAAGMRPVFVPATRDSGYLPDYQALDEETLASAALCILCSPGNPQGMAADVERLRALIGLCRRWGITLLFDECYAEIYNDSPPPSALQAAAGLDGSLEGMLVFHSLSKRSSAPGLRCGFVVGDPLLIDQLDAMLKIGGAGVPLPVLAAGTRLWNDDAHVEINRRRYRENFALAERILADSYGYRRPDGGFFLWLEVGDGESAAKILWAEKGIKVLPGAYMCHAGEGETNPGAAYIRVALVYDPVITAPALESLAETLNPTRRIA
jgi:aspartate/methionine/tyrosine aminotransferase